MARENFSFAIPDEQNENCRDDFHNRFTPRLITPSRQLSTAVVIVDTREERE